MFANPSKFIAAPSDNPTPIKKTDIGAGLDKLSTSLLSRFARTGRPFDVNEMYRGGFANVDLTELVRMGYLQPENKISGYDERAIMQRTGRYPTYPVYSITPKGFDAIGGRAEQATPVGISPGRVARSLGEAAPPNPNDPNNPEPDEDENDQGQPAAGAPQGQSAPQQATPAPGIAKPPAPQPGPPTPPKPPATPANGLAPKTPPAPPSPPATPGQAPAVPNVQAQPTPTPGAPIQPNQADTNQAKQIADQIKQTGSTDPATIDREIQKSVASSGKNGADQAAMSALIKQQMGITS